MALTSPRPSTEIQIGLHDLTVENLSAAMLCFWGKASFHGSPRSKVLLLSLLLKQSTGVLGEWLLNCLG